MATRADYGSFVDACFWFQTGYSLESCCKETGCIWSWYHLDNLRYRRIKNALRINRLNPWPP